MEKRQMLVSGRTSGVWLLLTIQECFNGTQRADMYSLILACGSSSS